MKRINVDYKLNKKMRDWAWRAMVFMMFSLVFLMFSMCINSPAGKAMWSVVLLLSSFTLSAIVSYGITRDVRRGLYKLDQMKRVKKYLIERNGRIK